MGHFSHNKDLSRYVYVPTVGSTDTRRTAVGGKAKFSDRVQQALEENGAVMTLPDPADIEPVLMNEARSLLRRLHDHIEQPGDGSNDCTDVPTAISNAIVETFTKINSGRKRPFSEALSFLLTLTSADPVSSTSLAQQVHPFDDDRIHQGSDAKLLDWILRGASHQCPSCNESFHLDQMPANHAVHPADAFTIYNNCLKAKHEHFCCFSCLQLIPLEEASHAINCYRQLYDERSAIDMDFDHICVHRTKSFQQFKQASFYVCPLASCMVQDWHKSPDADANTHWYGTSTIRCSSMRKDGPELGGGKLDVFVDTCKFLDHLASHFFEVGLVEVPAADANEGASHHTSSSSAATTAEVPLVKRFQVYRRLPTTLDEQRLICSVRNCNREWNNDDAGQRAYLCHLVNLHHFLIFHQADGSYVKAITPADEDKLDHVVPYLPETVSGMDDIDIQRPDPSLNLFYVRFRPDVLQLKAKQGNKTIIHSSKRPPALKRKMKAMWLQRLEDSLTEEQLEERREHQKKLSAAAYQRKKARAKEKTEEEKEAERAKNAESTKKSWQKRKANPENRKKKKEADAKFVAKKKAEDPEGYKKKRSESYRKQKDKDPEAWRRKEAEKYQQRKAAKEGEVSSNRQALDDI